MQVPVLLLGDDLTITSLHLLPALLASYAPVCCVQGHDIQVYMFLLDPKATEYTREYLYLASLLALVILVPPIHIYISANSAPSVFPVFKQAILID